MSNRHEVTLEADSIVSTAVEETGLPLVDDGFRTRLADVVGAYDEAGLDPVQRSAAAEALTEVVAIRLRLERDRHEHPRIADEEIQRPILIAGFPRAGTTLLHALLSVDPGNRAPEWWEVMHPSPPPGSAPSDDPRRQLAQREVADFVRRCPGVRRGHPYFVEGAATIMECESLLTFDLRNTYPFALHRVPVMPQLDLLGDPVEAFAFHRRFLQNLQWGGPARRWALKGTAHQFLLPVLLATYPDAVVIWPHRDPANLVASLTELTAVLHEGITGVDADRPSIAAGLVEGMRDGLSAAMSHPSIDADNVVHLHFDDVARDPLGQFHHVYERAGLAVTPEFETAIGTWLADDRHCTDRYGRFEYSLAATGMTVQELHETFSDYIDRFDIIRSST